MHFNFFFKTVKEHKIAILLIAFGTLLRLRQYFFKRNLWLDEAGFILNLQNKSYMELLGILDNQKISPHGFIWTQKFLGTLLGQSELSYRFLPIMVGIIILPLTYIVAKKISACKKTALVTLIFAVMSTALIYYSNEAKKYELEVLFTIILIYTHHKQSWPAFTITALLSILYTHSAIFFLAAIIFTDLVNKNTIVMLFKKHALWLMLFICYYYLALYNHPMQAIMETYHLNDNAFTPSKLNFAYFDWIWTKSKRLFVEPLGLSLLGAGLIFFLLGSYYEYTKTRFLVIIKLITPLILIFTAAALHKYPFGGRFTLFMFFPLAYLTAQGIVQSTKQSIWSLLIVITILFLNPIQNNIKLFIHPENKENITPLLNLINRHLTKGDVIFVSKHSHSQFKYYEKSIIAKNEYQLIRGQNVSKKYFHKMLQKLKPKKQVFFLFNHNYPIELPLADKVDLIKKTFPKHSIHKFNDDTFLIIARKE